MVKWLEEVTVTEGESDNFYHFHDNRVLPSHVTEQLAKAEGASSHHANGINLSLNERATGTLRACSSSTRPLSS